MKTYKDLVAEGKLDASNIPEGAMWVDDDWFAKYQNGQIYYWSLPYNSWEESSFELVDICKGETPLPNIWIPWIATEDSVSPVPDDFIMYIKTTGRPEGSRGLTSKNWCWNSKDFSPIFEYMIIDEDFGKANEKPEITHNTNSYILKPIPPKVVFERTKGQLSALYELYNSYDILEVKACIAKEMCFIIQSMLEQESFYE